MHIIEIIYFARVPWVWESRRLYAYHNISFNAQNVTRENVTITRLRYLGDWLPTLLYTENTSLAGSVLDYDLPTSHYTTIASVIGKLLYHDSQKVFSTSAQLPPYAQYWVSFAYIDYDQELLKRVRGFTEASDFNGVKIYRKPKSAVV